MKCQYCCTTAKRGKRIGVRLHKFPRDPYLRNLWVKACKVNEVGVNAKLCSAHFKKEDYINKPGYCSKLLKLDAIPSLFASQPGIFCFACGEIPFEDSGVTYHCFPEDNVLRNKWKTECTSKGLDVERVNDRVLLCSNHFSNESFSTDESGEKYLTANAIPSFAMEEMYPTECAPSSSTTTMEEVETNVDKISEMELSGNSTSITATVAKEVCANFGAKRQRDFGENLTSAATIVNETVANAGAERCHDNVNPKPSKKLKIWRPARAGDLKEEHFSTPRKAKRNFHVLSDSYRKYKREVDTLRQRRYYLKKKVQSLENLLSRLSDKNFISEDTAAHISASSSDTLRILLARRMQNKKTEKYPPELRAFALTLHFYSAKAYSYVRKTFKNVLPHPKYLSNWYQNVDSKPGFSQQAFHILKSKCEKKLTIVNLVIDEMSVMKRIGWDGNEYHGFVDLGTGLISDDSDSPVEVTNAWVCMAVSLNDSWKIPIGYFFIKSLNGTERANILNRCLVLLHQNNVKCHSLTFDGNSVNKSMCSILGASFEVTNLKPFFEHPVTKEAVYVFWDPCHMIKLIRNAFGDKKILKNYNGDLIQWSFLESLVELKNKNELSIANKLTTRHLMYKNQIMSVKLAAQTLSESVSVALTYLKNNEDCFKDAGATSEFCLIVNNSFDLLNIRNKFARKHGIPTEPINLNNLKSYITVISKYIDYYLNLRTTDNILLVSSNRGTGFLGMIICLENYINLFKFLNENYNLEYLLSFKINQDHLETFFSALRSRGGTSNNPTCRQFRASYKKLLIRTEIAGSDTGNCSILDGNYILPVANTAISEISSETENRIHIVDHGYINTAIELSAYIEDVVVYIAGFVVRKVKKSMTCETCKNALIAKVQSNQLINLKNKGGLVYPSVDVIKICIIIEKIIRQHNVFESKIKMKIFLQCFQQAQHFFLDLTDHILNQEILNNHFYQLVKLICDRYVDVRIHYICKNKIQKSGLRKKLTKTILFHNE